MDSVQRTVSPVLRGWRRGLALGILSSVIAFAAGFPYVPEREDDAEELVQSPLGMHVPDLGTYVGWYPDTPIASLDAFLTGGIPADMSAEERLTWLEMRWGDRIAGSFIDERSGEATVNIVQGQATDEMTALVMRANVTYRLVPFSAPYLRERLLHWSTKLSDDLDSAFVDPKLNKVVITPVPGRVHAVEAAVDGASEVSVASADQAASVSYTMRPTTRIFPLRGGTGMESGNVVCTFGFGAKKGTTLVYITAGHCAVAEKTFKASSLPVGSISLLAFPQLDVAIGEISPRWRPVPQVTVNRTRNIPIKGYREAPVGATVCKSGAKTGWTCGKIIAKNVAVRYKLATGETVIVHGLTKADVCTAPGDSGGPWMWGNQAQGVTSGGVTYQDGKCGALVGKPNISYFQPLAPVLQKYGLNLLVE